LFTRVGLGLREFGVHSQDSRSASLKQCQWKPPRLWSRYKYWPLSIRVTIPISPGLSLTRSNVGYDHPVVRSSGKKRTRSPTLKGHGGVISMSAGGAE